MSVVDKLITQITADASGYKREADEVLDKTMQMHSALSTTMTTSVAFATAMLGVATAISVAGVAASRKAADFDALIRSLAAVEGGLEAAARRWRELQTIAKAPGIGPEESLAGFTALRRSGLGADFSKKILVEFANQNALAGGGRAEFSRLITAVSQIATKPFLQGEELLQLTEAGVPAYKMVKDAFGTSDTEELKRRGITSAQVLERLVVELEKTARVGDSAKNTLENLDTAFDQVFIGIGDGINNNALPIAQELTAAFEDIKDSGIAQYLGEEVGGAFASLKDSLVGEGGLEGALIDVGSMIVTISAATRNWGENLKSVADWLNSGAGGNAFGPTPGEVDPETGRVRPMKGSGRDSQDISPFAEGERWRENAELMRELKKRQGAREKAAEETVDKVAQKSDKAENLLQQIAKNTEPLLDIRRTGLGGGDLVARGISAVDISRAKGARRAEAMIREAIAIILGPSLDDIARMQRT